MDQYSEALRKFKILYQKSRPRKLTEPTAVTLATADRNGRPSIRVVLLKSFDERGFVFYTNLHSRKGRELRENPWASMVFYWDGDDQIRIDGPVEQVSDEEADAYWATRPRDSQIGAWASLQSEPLESRKTFLKRIATFTFKFGVKPVPRPPHWSGFRLIPHRFEFWKKKPFRLHERSIFELSEKGWKQGFLYP